MTLSTFVAPPSPDDVAIMTQVGAPDVLALRTTNIPQVHLRLTELRQRADHPDGRPRQVWIDLSNCFSFAEMRGEVLVRALRMTQYLPVGFIGTSDKVKEIAKTASLPRVDTIDLVPRLSNQNSYAPVRVVPSAADIELEQQKDIARDLNRRLLVAVEDHAELSSRYDVVSRALGSVRTQRDEFENECQDLRTQVSDIMGRLEWAGVHSEATEAALAAAVSRLDDVEQERASAQARARDLEDHGATIETLLANATQEVNALRVRVGELEASESSQAEVIQDLRNQVDALDTRMRELDVEIQGKESSLREQIASLENQNTAMDTEISTLSAALSEARAALESEREAAQALVVSRDEVMRQSDLSSRMLEDTLLRIEEVSAQSESLYALVEQQRNQWEALNNEHVEVRVRLSEAQENLSDATQALMDAGNRAIDQRLEIERLTAVEAASEETRAALNEALARGVSLDDALTLARTRLEEAEQVSLNVRSELAHTLNVSESLRGELNSAQDTIDKLSVERNEALEEATALQSRVEQGLAEANRLQFKIEEIDAQNALMQSNLLDANHQLARAQLALDEQTRRTNVLSDLVERQGVELEAKQTVITTLEGVLVKSNQALLAEQTAHVAAQQDLHLVREGLDAERTSHQDARTALDNAQSLLGQVEAARADTLAQLERLNTDLLVEQSAHVLTRDDLSVAQQRVVDTENAQRMAAEYAEEIETMLASEKGDHASTRLTLDQTRVVLERVQDNLDAQVLVSEQLRTVINDANEQLVSEKQSHSSTRLTLDQTRVVLEKMQESFSAQNADTELARAEFERRLSLGNAENESLTRRLEAFQQAYTQEVGELENTITQARERVSELTQSLEDTTQRLTEAEAASVLSQVEIETLNANLEQAQGEIFKARQTARDQEEIIIEKEARIVEIASEMDATRVDLDQARAIVEARDQAVARLSEDVERVQAEVVQGRQELFTERQTVETALQNEAVATATVQRLSMEVERQDQTIVYLNGELQEATGREKEKDVCLEQLSGTIVEAQTLARTERRARAVMETELIDTQDALTAARKQIELGQAPIQTSLHEGRVRSGQQLKSVGDLVVKGAVSPGAELVAEGSVHVYSAMQGRVHAGCAGDLTARIYCMNFAAEVVTIGGRFVVFETIPRELQGRPVEIWFDQQADCMRIEPLAIA